MPSALLAAAAATSSQAVTNVTHGRSLVAHDISRAGTFCLGGKLVPLTFLLGCQRCGSNSLYEDIVGSIRGARSGHALRGEPDYYAREQHFYATDSWSRGMGFYADHFPECPGRNAHPQYQFTVDATPAYLRKPIVADRLQATLPGAAQPLLKFVVILRDPALRLYAYWDAFVLSGTGVKNFDNWLKVTMDAVRECQRNHGDDLWPPPDTFHCDEDTIEGVAAGVYHAQLEYWFKRFGPKRFLLTSTDAYEEDTQRVVKDVSHFLTGSAELASPARHPSNIDSIKVFGGMSSDARTKLGRFYQPHNSKLLHLLTHQTQVTFSPSVKQLGVQGWIAGG
mmetsp:Transcript_16273/g.52677  ORF Transcript_16273/g.52677 Transcript_16273/m.52677 type:complete len:337 (-) Transcript_16273:245-1255(-)